MDYAPAAGHDIADPGHLCPTINFPGPSSAKSQDHMTYLAKLACISDCICNCMALGKPIIHLHTKIKYIFQLFKVA